MDITYAFAGLYVRDRDQAVAWYEQFFGREPDFLPNAVEAVWQVATTASLYIYADPEKAGKGVAALVIDDLDTVVNEIAARGITNWELEDVPGAGRKANYTDPDGNSVSLIEISVPE